MEKFGSFKKDTLFANMDDPVPSFEFNREVSEVFDDMLRRSVPLYIESLKRQSELTAQFYKPDTKIYDLGCSHGNFGIMLDSIIKKPSTLIAVDSSLYMLEKYMERLQSQQNKDKLLKHYLVCSLAQDVKICLASVVVVNLTMQFIKPEKRDCFIKNIYDGMVSGGVLLLSEKICHSSFVLSDLNQNFYNKFKLENGYSELEISRKRDALENILIPEDIETHLKRVKKAGFKIVDVWLKWFNFASLIAIKN